MHDIIYKLSISQPTKGLRDDLASVIGPKAVELLTHREVFFTSHEYLTATATTDISGLSSRFPGVTFRLSTYSAERNCASTLSWRCDGHSVRGNTPEGAEEVSRIAEEEFGIKPSAPKEVAPDPETMYKHQILNWSPAMLADDVRAKLMRSGPIGQMLAHYGAAFSSKPGPPDYTDAAALSAILEDATLVVYTYAPDRPRVGFQYFQHGKPDGRGEASQGVSFVSDIFGLEPEPSAPELTDTAHVNPDQVPEVPHSINIPELYFVISRPEHVYWGVYRRPKNPDDAFVLRVLRGSLSEAIKAARTRAAEHPDHLWGVLGAPTRSQLPPRFRPSVFHAR